MVLSFEQEKSLEELKHAQRKELLELQEKQALADHNRKLERLGKLLEIAKTGGKIEEIV